VEEIRYKSFSCQTHKKNWRQQKPNVCQFELTFGCGLHCKHCYVDCYNKGKLLKKELNTGQVKLVLDKVRSAGALWLCFTGGDPLVRKDFLNIYAYAKDKGFIVTVFTNAYSMTEKIVKCLKNKPPFVIEVTLNAVTKDTYEKISQVKGSFQKAMRGVELIQKAKLPFKLKTQVTRDNLKEVPAIKQFVEGLGLRFRSSEDLHARLNGDLSPCKLRITPEESFNLRGEKHLPPDDEDCLSPRTDNRAPTTAHRQPRTALFRCAAGGGDGINIDPYGNAFICNLLRKPAVNLLECGIEDAMLQLLPLARKKKFLSASKCRDCKSRDNCHWCPGRAYVETGNMEKAIEYYCALTGYAARYAASRKRKE
jgi:radical SAM protein with 4Fe4S-binding SPASM domain